MKRPRLAGIILVSIIGPVAAIDETRQATFFDSVEVRYRQEYKACTGDMNFIPAKALIEWKNEINAVAKSREYLALLKEYRTVDSSENVLPCKVLAWNENRKRMQTAAEDTLARNMLDREEYENALKEAEGCAKSPYCVPGLPFGLSKKAFLLIFKNSFRVPFNDQGYYIYVNDMVLGDRSFVYAVYVVR
jgi:hypothetical protein